MKATNEEQPPETTDVQDAWDGYTVEEWPARRLKTHPENVRVFGLPEENSSYQDIRGSIRKTGIQEPLIVLSDGQILSGATRWAATKEVYGDNVKVPVRVHPGFASKREEAEYIIDANTKRRQLTPKQIAAAYKLLSEMPQSEGGELRKMGRPKKNEAKKKCSAGGSHSRRKPTSKEAAAERVGTKKHTAAALDTVFHTPGVPKEVCDAVDAKKLKPTVAAKVIKATAKEQGGTITDGAVVAEKLKKPRKLRTQGSAKAPANRSREDTVREVLDVVAAAIASHPDMYDGIWSELIDDFDPDWNPKKVDAYVDDMVAVGLAKKRLEAALDRAEAVGKYHQRASEELQSRGGPQGQAPGLLSLAEEVEQLAAAA